MHFVGAGLALTRKLMADATCLLWLRTRPTGATVSDAKPPRTGGSLLLIPGKRWRTGKSKMKKKQSKAMLQTGWLQWATKAQSSWGLFRNQVEHVPWNCLPKTRKGVFTHHITCPAAEELTLFPGLQGQPLWQCHSNPHWMYSKVLPACSGQSRWQPEHEDGLILTPWSQQPRILVP